MSIIRFLHQTTTHCGRLWSWHKLSIIRFLHQTTTQVFCTFFLRRCLSSDFYIKPQLAPDNPASAGVVYHQISTSNHNLSTFSLYLVEVVYHQISTSNHNVRIKSKRADRLSIIRFLHQTTTRPRYAGGLRGCLSSDFYIKPQPRLYY